MYNVLLLNNIKSKELEKLDSSKYMVSAEITDPSAIIVRSAAMHEMEFGPELLCIGRAGAGFNNIPTDRCADEGIVVFNAPGANSEAVKELAVCAILLSARDITGGVAWVKSAASQGDGLVSLVEKEKSRFIGPEISGKTLGIVGLGAIGAKLALTAIAMGMKVYGYDPYVSAEAARQLSRDITKVSELDEIYRESDFITLHVPYNRATHHLVNKESIAKMKQGVRIINLARGDLVCDDDILEALETSRVKCYVTDFPNNKTAGAHGVIAIPHLGASTPESEDNCVGMVCSSMIEYIENGNIVNSVNMTSANLKRTGDPRVCIMHRNIPEMIAKITSAISSCGVNIENMIKTGSKGRGTAYTILDINEVPEGFEESINSIDGVIRARVLP